MKIKKVTSALILVIIVVIAVYDVYAINAGGTEASISHTMRVWAHSYPAFTFAMGFTMGHLFWPITITPVLQKIGNQIRERK